MMVTQNDVRVILHEQSILLLVVHMKPSNVERDVEIPQENRLPLNWKLADMKLRNL